MLRTRSLPLGLRHSLTLPGDGVVEHFEEDLLGPKRSAGDLVQTVEELEALPYATVLWDDSTEPGQDALYQVDGMGYTDTAPWVLRDRSDRWCWFKEAPLPLRILHIPDAAGATA